MPEIDEAEAIAAEFATLLPKSTARLRARVRDLIDNGVGDLDDIIREFQDTDEKLTEAPPHA